MPKVFLSHSSVDKPLIRSVQKELNNSLISTVLDEDDFHVGDDLRNEIKEKIQDSTYFLIFISNDTIQSKWCNRELLYAIKHGKKIIPFLLCPKKELKQDDNSAIMTHTNDGKIYGTYSEANYKNFMASVLNAIWSDELIRFHPVMDVTAKDSDGIEMEFKRIKFKIKEGINLESNFLQTWDFDLLKFRGDKNAFGNTDNLLFDGISINWLMAYLTIPLANKHKVFLYNSKTEDCICGYAKADTAMIGKVLKLNTTPMASTAN